MNDIKISKIMMILFAVVFCFGPVGLAGPIGTAFTYQGRLIDSNNAADGLYDFQFKLYDANGGGNKLGQDVNMPEIDVIDGYFTAELDFGSAFDGNNRWLEIGVRPGVQSDPCAYSLLSPRQKVTPTPYALHARSVSAPLVLTAAGTPGTAILSVGSTGDGVAIGAQSSGGDIAVLGKNGTAVWGISPTGYAGYFDGKGYFSGNVGIGTASAGAKLDVAGQVKIADGSQGIGKVLTSDADGLATWQTLAVSVPLFLTGSVDSPAAVIDATNTSTGYGIRGRHNTTGNYGLVGSNIGGVYGNSTNSYGVFGSSSNAFGVYGNSTNSYGVNGSSTGSYGVYGSSANNNGVHGESSGSGNGVYGRQSSSGNYGYLGSTSHGVYGYGDDSGVFGQSSSSSGYGVYGRSSSGDSIGYIGRRNYGVYGESLGDGNGVYGRHNGSGNYGYLGSTSYGVYGNSAGSYGVYGESSGSGNGVYGRQSGSGNYGYLGGTNYGVYGNSAGSYGVYGESLGGGSGVYGKHNTSGNYGELGGSYHGVYGHSNNNDGVYGDSGSGIGVRGFSNFNDGVSGYSGTGSGVSGDSADSHGVYGHSEFGVGVYGSGQTYDFYAGGFGTDYGPFTGGHEVRLSDDFPVDTKVGMIVSVTGRTEVRRDDKGEISISSTLPTVRLCNVPNDKAVFGVFVAETPLPKDHWYKEQEGKRFATVNALGEGRVMVCNVNGEVQAGDYITTSAVPGYGQKQDDDLLRSCTLGKATETVDWDSVTETVEFGGRTYKIYLIGVVYTSG